MKIYRMLFQFIQITTTATSNNNKEVELPKKMYDVPSVFGVK